MSVVPVVQFFLPCRHWKGSMLRILFTWSMCSNDITTFERNFPTWIWGFVSKLLSTQKLAIVQDKLYESLQDVPSTQNGSTECQYFYPLIWCTRTRKPSNLFKDPVSTTIRPCNFDVHKFHKQLTAFLSNPWQNDKTPVKSSPRFHQLAQWLICKLAWECIICGTHEWHRTTQRITGYRNLFFHDNATVG